MRKRRPPNPHVLVGANRIQYDTADVFVVGITHRDGCTRNMSRKLCLNHRNSKLGLYQVLHRFDGEITETEGYSRFFGQSIADSVGGVISAPIILFRDERSSVFR